MSATFVDPDDLDTASDEGAKGEVLPAEVADGTAMVLHTAPPTTDVIPAQADLLALAQLANTFAGAELVPKPLQGKPADVLLVLLTARDLGLPATVALRECHPIDGRVTVSPKLKLAIVRERHLGRVWPDQANDLNEHTWFASRHDDPETVYRATYTWEDAVRAGLVAKTCTPTEHKSSCRCKRNWMTYPGQMLQWRALGYLMDQAFGEVGTGLYGADELGAITDDEGRIIDVAEVGNLPGMEVPEVAPRPPEPPADQAALWQLQVRIRALPDEQRAVLAERWKDSGRLTYEQDGKRHPFRPVELPAKAVSSAESMLTGFERMAGKAGWDGEQARTTVLATLGAIVAAYVAPGVVLQQATTPATAAVAAPVEAGSADGAEPDTDATSGRTEAEPSADAVEAAIATVKAMVLMDVEDQLQAAGLPVSGAEPTDRARLAQHLATA